MKQDDECYQRFARKDAVEILQRLSPAEDVPTQDELDKRIDDERNNLYSERD